jgi:hypothetical protein
VRLHLVLDLLSFANGVIVHLRNDGDQEVEKNDVAKDLVEEEDDPYYCDSVVT